MRAIERKIVGALHGGLNVSLSVRDRVETSENTTKYRLWGSCVFAYHRDVNEIFFSFCGYQTNTTKSRINALLLGFGVNVFVYQKNYSFFLMIDHEKYKIGASDKIHISLDNNHVDIVRACAA